MTESPPIFGRQQFAGLGRVVPLSAVKVSV